MMNEERVALKTELETLHRERNDATALEDSIFNLYQSHNNKYQQAVSFKFFLCLIIHNCIIKM